MLIRITLAVKIVAAVLRILLFPFLPPQVIYTCSLIISTWTLTLVLTYFYPRMALADPALLI
jgi:hypothetical protein